MITPLYDDYWQTHLTLSQCVWVDRDAVMFGIQCRSPRLPHADAGDSTTDAMQNPSRCCGHSLSIYVLWGKAKARIGCRYSPLKRQDSELGIRL